MITTVFFCALAVAAAGFGIKVWADAFGDRYTKINWFEFVAGTIVAALVIIPLVTSIGFHIAKNSRATYNEFWDGLESQAWSSTKTCHRDGSCEHHHRCDPYWVTVDDSYTDSKGRVHHSSHQEIRYHQCPDFPNETAFYVSDTLGGRYTFGHGIYPRDQEPRLWSEAKARIDSGEPGGTTQRHTYKNYILSNKDDIYAQNSGAIATYQKAGLLPKVQTKTFDFYKANKVYGTPPGGGWQAGLRRLDGKIGKEKHGDLHLVLVDSAKIADADQYTDALNAYWQSDGLGRDTISKNGIVVVVGYTAVGKVEWARAFTGMPQGNEGLAVSVRDGLTGVAATPEALLPAIEGLVFAPQPNGYKRVEMVSFKYLFSAIEPTGAQKFWIAFVAFILSMGIWALALLVDIRAPRSLETVLNTITNKKE